MAGERVLVAMSGGVDSSVAAALLVQAGYECIGATMQLWPEDMPRTDDETSCCSLQAVEDARRVAGKLGIPYYVFNMADTFQAMVIDPFAAAYLAGRTPNPCIACNRYLKFAAFLQKAQALDCAFIATGHYARTWRDDKSGRHCLARGRDRSKDQSYVLYPLTQEQLAHTLFPLGEYTKTRIRELAAVFQLKVAQKPESQEICFVPGNDYRRFLALYRPGSCAPGPILDTSGRRLGTHHGLAAYTIGQRKGLGIAAPRPLYVVDIDPARNAVVVGSRDECLCAALVADDVNWVSTPAPPASMPVMARIRYGAELAAATLVPLPEGRVLTAFAQPQRAVAPGQSVVWYQDDLVAGGGIIERKAKPEGVST